MKEEDVLSISLRFGGDDDDSGSSDSNDDGPPEGTEIGGDGEPIPPGEGNPYPDGG